MDPLAESVHAFAARHGLFGSGDSIVAAVSGGQDSCALLGILVELRDRLALRLTAAHFNHGLRGAEAEEEEAFARELAETLGVPFRSEKQDVAELARRLHLSRQQAARRARHAFLQRVRLETQSRRVALGHTRNDRVETVLLNILRGTGTDGLAGLRPAQEERIRPLLAASREETAAYCRRRGIRFRTDSSNESLDYSRNRVRSELIPLLRARYNAAVEEALLRLSDIAGVESDFLSQLAKEALAEIGSLRAPDEVRIPADRLHRLHPALRRRVLRAAIAQVRGSEADIEMRHVERLLEGSAHHLPLPGAGAVIEADGMEYRIARLIAPARALPFCVPLPVPGSVTIPQLGIIVRASLHPARGTADVRETNPNRAVMDADAVSLPLTVRSRRPGDRIRPLGMHGRRKIQDILTDRKAPAGERDRVPVVADANGPLWIVGHILDERARITPSSRKELRIEVVESGASAEDEGDIAASDPGDAPML